MSLFFQDPATMSPRRRPPTKPIDYSNVYNNGYSAETVSWVIEQRSKGVSVADLAAQIHVSASTIYRMQRLAGVKGR